MKVTCEQCGKVFNKPPCHIARTKRTFCSSVCRNLADRVRVDKNCKICGAQFAVRPSEAKRLSTCSKACYLKAKHRNKNGNWRGGVTARRKAEMSTARYKRWRASVFKRDDFTCVDCGKRGGDLEADHIKQWAHFPGLRYAVRNGATRCKPCHRKRKHRHSRKYQYKLDLKG
jgi:5-methylcytosine-specific restriction endonuclease McrA